MLVSHMNERRESALWCYELIFHCWRTYMLRRQLLHIRILMYMSNLCMWPNITRFICYRNWSFMSFKFILSKIFYIGYPLHHTRLNIRLAYSTPYSTEDRISHIGTNHTVKADNVEELMLDILALNSLKPRHNCCHFADDISKCISLNENAWSSIN